MPDDLEGNFLLMDALGFRRSRVAAAAEQGGLILYSMVFPQIAESYRGSNNF